VFILLLIEIPCIEVQEKNPCKEMPLIYSYVYLGYIGGSELYLFI